MAALARPPFRGALPKIRLHDLRHTWATLALVAGVDVKIVSERLGHSTPMIIWQTYQHMIVGMQTDAAERVASLILQAARNSRLIASLTRQVLARS